MEQLSLETLWTHEQVRAATDASEITCFEIAHCYDKKVYCYLESIEQHPQATMPSIQMDLVHEALPPLT